jgi:hypothetical protein
MNLKYLTREEIDQLQRKLPPGFWQKIDRHNIPDNADFYKMLHDKYGITKEELRAIMEYKSTQGWIIQAALIKRHNQKAVQLNKPFFSARNREEARGIKFVKPLDRVISGEKIPNELHGMPLYRGTRLSYGTALIKSGKKPGDVIRDPRYQSFSLNPGTAMFHTSTSQFGDGGKDTFKRKKRILLEHFAQSGETGLYGGNKDAELEVLYPRNKKWKISNIRDEDISFYDEDDPVAGKHNVRIYTIERKKKKVVKKKPLQRKKIIKRKPVKRCKCK